MTTLIITADEKFLKELSFCLRIRFPEVVIINEPNGNRITGIVKNELLDLVLLDCTVPGMKATDLIKRINENSEAAILVFCDTQDEIETADLLESGADDYSLKDFKPIRFLASINSILRRVKGTGGRSRRVITAGNLQVDLSSRRVTQAGKTIHLTPTEFNLLTELVQNKGIVLTTGMLLEKIWGLNYDEGSDFVKKYIHRLRHKLGDDAKQPRMILNERAIGYKFVSRELITSLF